MGKLVDKIIFVLFLLIQVLLPIYFDVRVYSIFDLPKVSLLGILSLFIAFFWLIKILTKELKITRTPLDIFILLFIITCLISTIFSINPIISLVGNYNSFEGLLTILNYIFLFYVAVNFINSHRRFKMSLNILILVCVIVACYGIFQHLGRDIIKWAHLSRERVYSSFGNPVFLSAYLISIIPLVVACFISNLKESFLKKSFGIHLKYIKIAGYVVFLCVGAYLIFEAYKYFLIAGSKQIQISDKILPLYINIIIQIICLLLIFLVCYLVSTRIYTSFFYLIFLLIIFYSFVWTQTRACWLGLFFAACAFIILLSKHELLRRKFRFLTVFGSLGLMILILSFYYPIFGRFDLAAILKLRGPLEKEVLHEKKVKEVGIKEEDLVSGASRFTGSAEIRLLLWKDAVNILKDYPLIGAGLDTLEIIYPKYRSYQICDKEGQFTIANRAHNDILDVGVSRGIVGIIVYLFLVGYFIYFASCRVWRSQRYKILLSGILCGFLGYFIQLEFSFGVIPTSCLFWVLMGLFISGVNLESPKQIKSFILNIPCKHKLLKVGIIIVFFIFIVYLINLSVRRYIADFYYKMSENSTNPIYYLQKALSLAPYTPKYYDFLARAYISDEKYKYSKETYDFLNKSKEFIPQNSGFWNYLGLYYFHQDNFKKAIKCYKKATELNPYFAGAWNNLGVAYVKTKKYLQAVSSFKKAFISNRVDNKSLDHIGGIGQIFVESGEYEKAYKVFKDLEELLPLSFEYDKVFAVYNQLAQLALKLGKKEEAIKYYKKLLKLTPNDPYISFQLRKLSS